MSLFIFLATFVVEVAFEDDDEDSSLLLVELLLLKNEDDMAPLPIG
jgi:hypothetical protein